MTYLHYSYYFGITMAEETRHDRFKRVAAKRTNDILDKMRILGNCYNKSSYEYTEEEINKIFSEIDKQLKMTKAKFLGGKRERFRL
jgi:Ca2+-binding EF-hand superfamily protein